jgi:hypothetical protein
MKVRLPMLLLAAVAALAIVAHKGTPTAPAQLSGAAAVTSKRPPKNPPLVVLDDPAMPDTFIGVGGAGLGGVFKRPIPTPRPKAPVFTDIGQQADVGTSHFGADSNVGDQVVQKELQSQVPLAGTVFAVADMVLGGGNGAGVSPQQLAYIKQQIARGVEPGRALALAEGRLGAKQILINGDYVTIGGSGLGGPGFSDVAEALST